MIGFSASAARSERMELSPRAIRSSRVRCRAEPEASVSRHPFLPQWHSISLSKALTWPNSPEKPDLPVYIFPSMMMPMPSPQLMKEDVLLPLHAALHQLAVGHGACVVVYAYVASYLLAQDFRQRPLGEVEGTEAVARLGVHPPGDVEVDIEYLPGFDARFADELPDEDTQLFQPLRRILELIGDIHLQIHHVSLEVHQPDVQGELLDVHSDEVARFRVQAVEARMAAADGLQLAVVVDVAVVTHLVDELGDGGYAQVELPGKVGNCGATVVHVVGYDPLLEEPVLAPDFYFI